MTFTENPNPPTNHPIGILRARELVAGDLGDVYRGIVANCVAPLYWHSPTSDGQLHIHSNGTLTFVRTSECIIGVTAAHVLAA